MKRFIILGLCLTTFASAHYEKPQLLARYFSNSNFNVSNDSFCYLGTPAVSKKGTILRCQRLDFQELMYWDEFGHASVLFSTKNLMSTPQVLGQIITWYEYDQEGVISTHQYDGKKIHSFQLNKDARAVSFIGDKWIIQSRESLTVQGLGSSKNADISDIAYLFSPAVSHSGEYAVKVRKNSISNHSPDEIWSYKNDRWFKVFSDKDGDPQSKWISFDNSLAIGDGKVFVIAQDKMGSAIIEISDHGVREIAREGKDLKKFDSFSIAYGGGVLVFRGVDFEDRKVVYQHDGKTLGRALTQGDTILTDLNTVGMIHYKDPHAVIYNNPSVGVNGDIVIQATITDYEDKKSLMGVGVIRINKADL